eukprot:1158973-Pelagomonas_calceolata.AAC.5
MGGGRGNLEEASTPRAQRPKQLKIDLSTGNVVDQGSTLGTCTRCVLRQAYGAREQEPQVSGDALEMPWRGGGTDGDILDDLVVGNRSSLIGWGCPSLAAALCIEGACHLKKGATWSNQVRSLKIVETP